MRPFRVDSYRLFLVNNICVHRLSFVPSRRSCRAAYGGRSACCGALAKGACFRSWRRAEFVGTFRGGFSWPSGVNAVFFAGSSSTERGEHHTRAGGRLSLRNADETWI